LSIPQKVRTGNVVMDANLRAAQTREKLLKAAAEQKLQIVKLFEQRYGGLAREILAGRNKVLANSKMRVRS
jgi:predicted kinase